MNAAARSYVREFSVAMIAYAIVVVVAFTLIRANPDAPWRFPLALAPIIPALLMVRAVVRDLDRMDELQRRMQLEALAFAFGGSAVLTFSYGLLESVGLPHINWMFVWPVMGSLWILGRAIAARRYR